ncbi:hypothetical protein ABB29_03085 [Pseudoxanthomonas dokdonensis]|uniref:M23ase beta-sheet core domain-containing protein n=1 Tax=Pseudoxanthomonas dokdonensis TaxID=344882 RepID=A0A0R0CZ86_9GAMM|nr:hypothetical protein ABB29_03085 [Pseudoxanthomonas dokdonensis]
MAILAALLLWLMSAVPALQRPGLLWELWRSAPPQTVLVPVDNVRAQDIADTWGGARSGGRGHQGVDIFAPRGTPVRSVGPGIVLQVGHNTLGGNVVWVLGRGRQRHYYAHLDSFGPVSRGDLIESGQLLGHVGDSGNAKGTPTHLHYGIYVPGQGAINPWPMLRDLPEPSSETKR